jgi:hypothetical protein
MDKKNELKEVKIYLDAETKEWLQKLAKEQGKPFRTFLVDSLVDLYSTSYLEKELMKLRKESELIKHIKVIKTN